MFGTKIYRVVMEGEINPGQLKPHPKNQEYYSDLPDEKYRELKRSIEANGMRDPLKILPDYTVVSGHQRLKIALELGLEAVPFVMVEIVSDDPEREAEYLLIAENDERRQSDNDPMKKARRAKFLREYWGIREGRPTKKLGQNVLVNSGKTLDDIAEAIGEERKTTQRLLKLNDLIPEFQALVSSGKLGTTAAEQIAYLSPEAQAEIYRQIKEQITDMTVAEVKDLRRKVEEKERLEKELEQVRAAVQTMESRAIEAEDQLNDMRRELSNIQDRLEEAIRNARKEEREAAEEEIAKLQEKVNRLSERAEKLKQDKEKAEARVKEIEEKLASAHQAVEEQFRKDLADKEKRIKVLEEEIAGLNRKIAELESRPPEVIEKAPEDYEELKQMIRTLKKEKEKAESELLGLTREQIEQKDRYWVRDIVTKIAQDVGKHVTKLRYEMERRSIDAVAYKDIMDCADLLVKIAGELRETASLRERTRGSDYVEIVV
ncbi:ParB-like nuclease domain-containing protein [Desulfofundulus australicus DSM 11792]|uniref:ParB-like nuclease domain-containing protein n=1 Tax=Desulfofundulus australicus DSM 11792 TaxID=1121425 RepID=A0A1M5DG96_9FIRM|nr:ParB N-terminal domain-containing protein [Desulfofundulus australicus]SHF66053.1 ParB-like nuclease domain-containing protein [Desulfofundulus australicus DSM 11792]